MDNQEMICFLLGMDFGLAIGIALMILVYELFGGI